MTTEKKRTTCTAYTDPPKRCGREDDCTLVRVVTADDVVRHEHWVCGPCRKRMGLPNYSVEIRSQGMVRI